MKSIFSFPVLLALAVSILLLLATANHPYGYYTFLRWFVFITSLYFAYLTYNYEPKIWLSVYLFIAILFNPIFPIYLNRDIWTIIDIATSIYFIIAVFSVKKFRKN